MFDTTNHEKIKELTKRLDTTQASLVNGLVQFALDNINDEQLEQLDVIPAKKKGRKKKVVVEVTDELAAAEAALANSEPVEPAETVEV